MVKWSYISDVYHKQYCNTNMRRARARASQSPLHTMPAQHSTIASGVPRQSVSAGRGLPDDPAAPAVGDTDEVEGLDRDGHQPTGEPPRHAHVAAAVVEVMAALAVLPLPALAEHGVPVSFGPARAARELARTVIDLGVGVAAVPMGEVPAVIKLAEMLRKTRSRRTWSARPRGRSGLRSAGTGRARAGPGSRPQSRRRRGEPASRQTGRPPLRSARR